MCVDGLKFLVVFEEIIDFAFLPLIVDGSVVWFDVESLHQQRCLMEWPSRLAKEGIFETKCFRVI